MRNIAPVWIFYLSSSFHWKPMTGVIWSRVTTLAAHLSPAILSSSSTPGAHRLDRVSHYTHVTALALAAIVLAALVFAALVFSGPRIIATRCTNSGEAEGTVWGLMAVNPAATRYK